MTRQPDYGYRNARKVMLQHLDNGEIEAGPLAELQSALAAMEPHRAEFGEARYAELKAYLDEVEKLPVIEPVFVRHPPAINHRRGAWHHQVPYPYTFKIDGGWLLVMALAAGGLVFKPLMVIAVFIAFCRCLVWCAYRFPMTTYLLTAFLSGLLGGGRRRRW